MGRTTLLFVSIFIYWISVPETNAINAALHERVRAYLKNSHRIKAALSIGNGGGASGESSYLENSNKIGLGFDPVSGSPVCYTGGCQMVGFREPIFKLDFTKVAQGSCTTKLIPQHVSLDCLPSTEVYADTETIDSLEQLKQSTSKKVDISGDFKLKVFSFSYKYSGQTKYMIDNIVKDNMEVLYTSAEINYAKLTMFEPFMKLSDEFIYVIENLPCCDYNEDVQQYINEFIFEYFGFTYVRTLLLGGIGRQSMSIKKSDVSLLVQQGYNRKHEAQLQFYISLNGNRGKEYDKQRHEQFMRYVQVKHATTLGGDTSIQSIDDWSKTVQSNPIVTKFGIKYIFDLLNKKRFPNDPLIGNKSQLIQFALNKHLENSLFCYNDCSGHGVCESTGYFQFGLCNCTIGWKGFDCSILDTTTTTTTTATTTNYVPNCHCLRFYCGECIRWSCPELNRRRRRFASRQAVRC